MGKILSAKVEYIIWQVAFDFDLIDFDLLIFGIWGRFGAKFGHKNLGYNRGVLTTKLATKKLAR